MSAEEIKDSSCCGGCSCSCNHSSGGCCGGNNCGSCGCCDSWNVGSYQAPCCLTCGHHCHNEVDCCRRPCCRECCGYGFNNGCGCGGGGCGRGCGCGRRGGCGCGGGHRRGGGCGCACLPGCSRYYVVPCENCCNDAELCCVPSYCRCGVGYDVNSHGFLAGPNPCCACCSPAGPACGCSCQGTTPYKCVPATVYTCPTHTKVGSAEGCTPGCAKPGSGNGCGNPGCGVGGSPCICSCTPLEGARRRADAPAAAAGPSSCGCDCGAPGAPVEPIAASAKVCGPCICGNCAPCCSKGCACSVQCLPCTSKTEVLYKPCIKTCEACPSSAYMEVDEVNALECQYTRAIDCESVPYALKTTYTDPCGCNTWSCCRPICKKKGCKILCAYSYQPEPTCEECCCTDCCCCPRLATRWNYNECRRKGLAWLPDIYFKGYNCGNKAAAQLVGNVYPNDDNCFGQVKKPYKAIASDICI